MLLTALAAVSVNFAQSQELIQKQQKDETNPTLNVIKLRKTMSTGKPVADPYDKEQIRMSEAIAQKEAFDLYHEVRETKGYYMKEHDKLFTDAKIIMTEAGMGRPIKVGTDCSGIEAPIQALQNLNIKCDHIFSSESDEIVKNTIKANWKPKIFYDDVTQRENKSAPCVDLYIVGFPCQPCNQFAAFREF